MTPACPLPPQPASATAPPAIDLAPTLLVRTGARRTIRGFIAVAVRFLLSVSLMPSRMIVASKKKKKTAPDPSAFGGVIDGAESLLVATADLGEGKIVELRDRLQTEIDSAREHLEALEAQLKERVASVDDYVHENPWQAVGIAAAAGVIVGVVAFR